MMALRLDMYSSTVIRSNDQPLDSPSTSGETHRKSVLLRKNAAKGFVKKFWGFGLLRRASEPRRGGRGREKRGGEEWGFQGRNGGCSGISARHGVRKPENIGLLRWKVPRFLPQTSDVLCKEVRCFGGSEGWFPVFSPPRTLNFFGYAAKKCTFPPYSDGEIYTKLSNEFKIAGKFKVYGLGRFQPRIRSNE